MGDSPDIVQGGVLMSDSSAAHVQHEATWAWRGWHDTTRRDVKRKCSTDERDSITAAV